MTTLKKRLAKLEAKHPDLVAQQNIEIVAGYLAITECPEMAGTSTREGDTVTSYGLTLQQAIETRDAYKEHGKKIIMLVEPCGHYSALS
ncbi:hypothetical protein [Oceanisphaera pacifica]|uniref:Uncharacterized protein n=1 Tax=Oceanisphaera pacifica TaxID=2818389 RepID=A0ABS3NK74_9GAMM|nr:hypothetical protein [Oceanisphaera pacifica]MBO1520636.1 hypothetical protein [Oceanisphaera pacifica]